MRRNPLKAFLIFLFLFMILWSAYQIYVFIGNVREGQGQDAEKMLYQVSLFQFELLNGYLQDSANSGRIVNPDALKQLLYLTHYTHERLVLTFGESRLSRLESMNRLLQYMMRIQISGRTQLSEEESELFRRVADIFGKLYGTYAQLLDSDGDVISSQNDLLHEFDREIIDALQKFELGT